MKKNFLPLLVLLFLILSFWSWPETQAQNCAEEPRDRGECDSLNVICIDCEIDTSLPGPYIVQFPILITHDVIDYIDSVSGIVIPLGWTHTNPAAYCSVSSFWNTTLLPYFPNWEAHSIFRDLETSPGDTLFNWMADLARVGQQWSNILLSLDNYSNFWIALVPTTQHLMGDEDRALMATITLKAQDTMHVCIDTTLWPPNSHLTFSRSDGIPYVPRDNLPYCFWIGPPQIQITSPNGGENWPVGTMKYITWLSENFDGASVKIEYSTNSGTNWNTIIESTLDTGTYSWLIPDTPSDSCRVRVSDAEYEYPFSESDADFSIVQPDFTIEAEPDTQSVEAGQSADFNVILNSLFEFSSPCTLTVTGMPKKASASFEPNPTIPTDTSILTITSTEITPIGTYDLTITATDTYEPQIQHSANVVLKVNPTQLLLEEAMMDSQFVEGGASGGEHCNKCIVDTCTTLYTIYGDVDGDGMDDDLEILLANQFKPVLYLDNAESELPYFMPGYYDVPFYSDDSPGHNAPPDVISNGTVYYRVHPFGIVEDGRCRYIQIDYWFYFIYNQAECTNGNRAAHGHDWEHISMALVGSPGDYQAQALWYAQHEGGEYRQPDEVSWVGIPHESGVNVFIVNGSHASYHSPGQRCTVWRLWICWCYENANGQRVFSDIVLTPLWELSDSRAPAWLDYYQRWPGLSTVVSQLGLHFYPPYGPAWGNHEQAWLIGRFGGHIPFCERTWLQDIPVPESFEVSKFKNGQPLTNALYLTWDGPSGWDGFMLRRCLVPIQPNSNDPSCECIAQLSPDTYSYFDSCLDGGRTYYYELKTFNDNPNPTYQGCSWPAQGEGTPSGGPCTEDMTPAPPVVKGCDTCVLRWEDYSWNEDGFAIELHDEICGTVGPNVETYRVSNCCTGNRRSYQVGAYNQYGERWSTLGMPCNDPPDCEPRFGCEGELYEVPYMNRWGCSVLIGLMIGMSAFLINRRKENKTKVL